MKPNNHQIINIIFLFFFSLLSTVSNAQISLNSGFEEWSPSGNPPPFNWEFPTDWTANNAATEFISAGVRKSTDSYEGAYAAELSTLIIFGEIVPSVLVNGNGIINYIESTVNIITAGHEIENAVEKISGSYKFIATSPGDSAEVVLITKKYNVALSKIDTIEIVKKRLPPTTDYTTFELEILFGTDLPDSLILAFYSTNPASPLEGGVLFVDDISVGVVGLKEEVDQQPFVFYPNPSDGLVTIELDQNFKEKTDLSIIDITGAVVYLDKFAGGTKKINLSGFTKGVYFIQISTSTSTQIQKLIIQ